MNFLGLDIGATKIRYVIWDNRQNRILKEEEIKYQRRVKPEFLRVLNFIKENLKKEEIGFKRIGIGVAGVIKNGRLTDTPNFPALLGFKIIRELNNVFKTTVIADNDARVFTYAEAVAGVAKNYQSVIGLTLGTGLGGGIVIDKKIYHGRGGAGEIGRMVFPIFNSHPPIFNFKEAEDLCSEKFFKLKAVQDPLAAEIKAREGDKKYRKIYEEFGENVGLVIANIIHILDPSAIVLGGGLSHAYDLFIKSARDQAKKLTADFFSRATPILKSRFGKSSGAVGAALLAGENFRENY